MTLKALGWTDELVEAFAPLRSKGSVPARVGIRQKGHYIVYTEAGELRAEIRGTMHLHAKSDEDYPTVGDWVGVQTVPNENLAIITGILPRRTAFRRKTAGERFDTQVVAANIDTVFLVNAADPGVNLRRLERFLVVAAESGVSSVIILNKVDLVENAAEMTDAVRSVAPDIPLLLTTAVDPHGADALLEYLPPRTTGALLGPSGVGKSTLINALLGEEYLRTGEVRIADSKGRHTTAHRELVLLPSGALMIDTPGMRELQPVAADEGLSETYDDIEDLTLKCRFRNCRHETEPGCAILAAIEDGSVDASRVEGYLKMQRAQAFVERKFDKAAQLREKQRMKKLMIDFKRGKKK